jgi:hypothetical protein
MGGGAGVLAAAGDSTIGALVGLAAAETNPSAVAAAASVTSPVLLLGGSADCVTPLEQHLGPIYQALASGCRALVVLEGASHCQFAGSGSVCELGEIGCPSPTLSRSEQQALAGSLLAPWLDAQVRGDAQAWADYRALVDAGAGLAVTEDCPGLPVASSPPAPAPPEGLHLSVLPNPFNPRVTLRWDAAPGARATVSIHDAGGGWVWRGSVDPGAAGEIVWDGRDVRGRPVASGIYFARVETGGRVATGRMVLLR